MNFSNWDDIIYSVVKQYEKQLDLPHDFYKHFSNKFRMLKIQYRLLSSKAPYIVIKAMEKIKWGQPIVQASTLLELEYFKRQKTLLDNQFVTIGNSHASNFIWFDPNTYHVLNVSQGNFSLDGLCAIDRGLNLYHPSDVKHVIRYGVLAFYILTLKGIEFDALKDYYVVRFRIGRENFENKEGINNSVKVVERKCFSMPLSDQTVKNSTNHLDLWTLTESCRNFNHITTDFVRVGKPQWSKFVNILFYIFNAHVLGFKPKHITVLNYLNKYDQSDECLSSLNREIRKLKNTNFEFDRKAFNDFNWALNQKLTHAIKNNTIIKKGDLNDFERLNRLYKAKQLGLIPVPETLQKTIIQNIS